jgi:Cu(I)/Ag(I) efflux system periplasmic protein CusF
MHKTLRTKLTVTTLALLTPLSALGQDNLELKLAQAAEKPATGDEMTDAEVRKVDVDASKITLKHAEIKRLDMPAMTMVFVVKDKAMLEKLKAGDKVKFRAINDAGRYTVTAIQLAP